MKLNKNNYVIGVTGGVGSGKSTVIAFFRNETKARVYMADRVSEILTKANGAAYDKVRELFGEEYFSPEGILIRSKVAELVFRRPEMLEALNNIIHPEVRKFLHDKVLEHSGLVVLEAALPEEAGFKELCDEIWYIRADSEIRIKRLMAERGYSREKCLDIMNNQLSEEKFMEIADRVIDNSGDFDSLRRKIFSALEEINFKG